MRASSVTPHPLAPDNLRDLTIHKMLFRDNYQRGIVADKIAVRGWVRERVGDAPLIPVYDICNNADELKPESYPRPFIVKSNHASGDFHIVHTQDDINGLKEKAQGWLSRIYRPKTEWVYHGIERKLIVEKLLVPDDQSPLADIKIHCAFGQVLLIIYFANRQDNFDIHYLDADWNLLETDSRFKATAPKPPRPNELDTVLDLVRKLTADFDFIRLDLYICNGHVYFGELTNFNMAGGRKPHMLDYLLYREYERIFADKIARERQRLHQDAERRLTVN